MNTLSLQVTLTAILNLPQLQNISFPPLDTLLMDPAEMRFCDVTITGLWFSSWSSQMCSQSSMKRSHAILHSSKVENVLDTTGLLRFSFPETGFTYLNLLRNEQQYKRITLSGVVCSLLTQADKASSSLSFRGNNNDEYPGEAENRLYMKLFAKSFETDWT